MSGTHQGPAGPIPRVIIVDETGAPVGAGTTSTGTVQPTQLLGAVLTTGENSMWPNMLSITVVNNTASTGNITVNAVGDAIIVEPGESVGWDAAPSSVLSTLTITVPAGTAGRMFGTRAAGV